MAGFMTEISYEFDDGKFAIIVTTPDNDDNFHTRLVTAIEKAIIREFQGYGLQMNFEGSEQITAAFTGWGEERRDVE